MRLSLLPSISLDLNLNFLGRLLSVHRANPFAPCKVTCAISFITTWDVDLLQSAPHLIHYCSLALFLPLGPQIECNNRKGISGLPLSAHTSRPAVLSALLQGFVAALFFTHDQRSFSLLSTFRVRQPWGGTAVKDKTRSPSSQPLHAL